MNKAGEQPAMAKILEITDHGANLRTLWLDCAMTFTPGQFAMLWLPGVDEKPYAPSDARTAQGWTPDGNVIAATAISITARKRGPFSKRLFELKAGDSVGVRGPYGKGFVIKRPACIVSGGVGIATVAPLKKLIPNATFICGAQTRDEVIFADRFDDMIVCTDDGSMGYHGYPSERLAKALDEQEFGVVYTCGPELMMKAVLDVCETRRIECQASLERYMKCGFGVCGHCACDDKLVCKDGPVFGSEVLRTLKEFGRFHTLKNGRREAL